MASGDESMEMAFSVQLQLTADGDGAVITAGMSPLLTTRKNHKDLFRVPILHTPLAVSHLLNDCVHFMPSILSTIILCCTINAPSKKTRDPSNKVSGLINSV